MHGSEFQKLGHKNCGTIDVVTLAGLHCSDTRTFDQSVKDRFVGSLAPYHVAVRDSHFGLELKYSIRHTAMLKHRDITALSQHMP